MKQNTASARVAADLRRRIRDGALRPGERVPSARAITKEWGVAIATAMKALAILRREGLVRPEPGVGTIVCAGERAPDLSRERIVQTAIAIADDEGLAALSMRGIAMELGVATMSLYRHVPSRDDLLLLMVDAVMAEDALPSPAGRTWRTQLEALARVQWAVYRRHAWLPHVLSMTRPQVSKSGMRHTEYALRALASLGWSHAALLQTGVAFLAYVRGMAVGLEAERFAERDTGMTHDEWMQTQEPSFAAVMPSFPVLARVSGEADVDMSLDALFARGLAHFLDGIAAAADASP